MLHNGRRITVAYSSALLAVALATLVRLALRPLVGGGIPFLTYFVGCIFVAWRFGFGPAIAAIVFSVVVGGHFVLAAGSGHFFPSFNTGAAQLAGFAVATVTAAYLLDRRQQALQRAVMAETEHRRANEELKIVNKDLEALAFAASHDLREPLRTVTNYSELLIEAVRNGRTEEAEIARRFISENTARMSQMLTDLSEYTRLMIELEERTAETVDLNLVVGRTRETLAALMQREGASVTHDPLPRVTGREVLFGQLFQNLIENSIKYRSEQPPRIHISARKESDHWVLSVADNGIGIPPQYQDQVFGFFKRLHGRNISGTGVGLAICRRIAERGGGRIWIESDGDHGSTFHITLPDVSLTKTAY